MARIELQQVQALIDARRDTARKLAELAGDIHAIATAVVKCFESGGTVYACGNGGSATEATHFVAELVGRFKRDRRALPAFSLSDNAAAITALANDYDYDNIFAHQIRGLARPGDCLFALSTSGSSPNVVQACHAAREKEMRIFGFTGATGAEMKSICDIALCVDFDDTARIQEVHLMVIHLVCELVEESLFGDADDGTG